MKKILILIFMLRGINLYSQGLSNLFSQQAADIKYVLAQIALVQVYIGYVEKGYQIAHDGLELIGEIKQGDFNMHSFYFNSLKTVSPSVARYSKIGAILSMHQSISSCFKKGFQKTVDWPYINTVYSNLMDECSKNLDELISVTTDAVLEMSDDERIKRIDQIYIDMKDKLSFAQYFTGDASLLVALRQIETNDVNSLKSLE